MAAVIEVLTRNTRLWPLASTELADGQATVAIGHPLGFKNSVVSGLVAGERDFGGAAMWQVAMTIEPGNSGGPLLDMQGNVHGVISMKSTGREPFGFAVKVKQLRKLIEKPNPIAIEQCQDCKRLENRTCSPRTFPAAWPLAQRP